MFEMDFFNSFVAPSLYNAYTGGWASAVVRASERASNCGATFLYRPRSPAPSL